MSHYPTPTCPGCDDPPMLLLGGGRQAFCGNEACAVFTWDPALTVEELSADAQWIEMPGD